VELEDQIKSEFNPAKKSILSNNQEKFAIFTTD